MKKTLKLDQKIIVTCLLRILVCSPLKSLKMKPGTGVRWPPTGILLLFMSLYLKPRLMELVCVIIKVFFCSKSAGTFFLPLFCFTGDRGTFGWAALDPVVWGKEKYAATFLVRSWSHLLPIHFQNPNSRNTVPTVPDYINCNRYLPHLPYGTTYR